ncbi:MAG TPA: rRNA maturation RNase YbeY [Clostridia bacterium]|jgi:probable rRNA maturation factor|nr:rRNA maturation RNase YbeY [Clostridia bacterium]
MELLVSNEQGIHLVTTELELLFKKVLEAVLQAEGETGEVEVSLVLVDDKKIQELNRDYRGIDRPTDVLSFPLREAVEDEGPKVSVDEWLLGDIVVSMETALRQAEEYGHSLERELGFLIVHGCLHLLGYDHQREEERQVMREKEEAILTSLGLTR